MEVLKVERLSFRHEDDGPRQVHGVSFGVKAGRTYGILGGNECGKTTLAHLLMANLVPQAGSVTLFGEEVARRAAKWPRWRTACRMALIACAIAVPLLFYYDPFLVVFLLRRGAWSLPLMLMLLELAARFAARRQGASGASEAVVESGEAPPAMYARGVAYISSEHDAGQKLPADSTIEEVIGRHMPLPKEAKEARRREVCAALKASGFRLMAESGTPVGTPEDYLADGLKCGELSGGQKHLVYMLSVLASRPRLLICDDCLCGLDIDRQSSMVTLLQNMQLTFGVAIIYMTVDLTSFTLMAHDGAFMKHGRFIETGTAEDLVTAPQRKDTLNYVQCSEENEERSHGKNLRMAYRKGESVFSL